MSAPGKEGATGFGERLEILGLRAVLLAYWGTASVLSRCGGKPRSNGGESVHPKR
ncbi:hypothetical protein OOK43_31480 [[Kitasatospora] papulosa]|uniref:Uncharacterized protein n=2 Tax=Streptomyces TaxID=1883 RepID=A0A8D3WM81_STRFA|nr:MULTISPECIES: hypothetical protein [Streptomyces]RAS32320.1 acyl-CoA oxidase [Streptomyces avidinii]SNX76078.1 acyl-CoA oxidase [Streptomyces microflavus]MCX4417762.1 hypothetical protein [[Kitasatospora] papulosa]MCY1649939.1 hypothetical protein [Streptomyces sp. SL203]MDF6060809.1 hypothetical protein [Streptomyces sp. JH010]